MSLPRHSKTSIMGVIFLSQFFPTFVAEITRLPLALFAPLNTFCGFVIHNYSVHSRWRLSLLVPSLLLSCQEGKLYSQIYIYIYGT